MCLLGCSWHDVFLNIWGYHSGHFADLDFWSISLPDRDREPHEPKKNTGETRLFFGVDLLKWKDPDFGRKKILNVIKHDDFFQGHSGLKNPSENNQVATKWFVLVMSLLAVERILSHPLMSLCPMHIYLENPGEFLEEWQVFFGFRHQLDVKHFLSWNPERFQVWTEKPDFAKSQRCCAKSCFLTRQVAVLHSFTMELYLILPLLHSFWHTLTYLDNILMVDEKQRWITDDKKQHQFGRSN